MSAEDARETMRRHIRRVIEKMPFWAPETWREHLTISFDAVRDAALKQAASECEEVGAAAVSRGVPMAQVVITSDCARAIRGLAEGE